MQDRDIKTNKTINLGLGTNIFLALAKTLIGVFGHSSALLADGINSTSDVVYYVAVKILSKQASKPADAEHPYGHRQLESISSIVIGAFILTTGVAIFWGAINSMYELLSETKAEYTVSIFALVAALLTFVLKIYLFTYTRKNQKQTQNPTLRALANDHLNDIMASVSVVVGVIGGRMGFLWMDPLAGAIVSIFILKTGISIIMDSSSELMDAFPDLSFRDELSKKAAQVQGVKHVDLIGMHRFGPFFTINVEIGVDGNLTIQQGHDIADRVEATLMEAYSVSLKKVHVHYHPVEYCLDKEG
jgi:cation diffusion facilitator family transporter